MSKYKYYLVTLFFLILLERPILLLLSQIDYQLVNDALCMICLPWYLDLWLFRLDWLFPFDLDKPLPDNPLHKSLLVVPLSISTIVCVVSHIMLLKWCCDTLIEER